MSKGIEPIDPTRRPGPLTRGMHRLARTDLGRGFGIRVAAKLDPHLLRLSRGRVALTGFFPLVRLVAVGRKSGDERIVPLLYFTRGEEVILVASSFGRARHPAWYLNVEAEPRVELIAPGGRRLPYLARKTEGEERRRLLELADGLYGGYGDYLRRTEGVRQIPVLALAPRQGR